MKKVRLAVAGAAGMIPAVGLMMPSAANAMPHSAKIAKTISLRRLPAYRRTTRSPVRPAGAGPCPERLRSQSPPATAGTASGLAPDPAALRCSPWPPRPVRTASARYSSGAPVPVGRACFRRDSVRLAATVQVMGTRVHHSGSCRFLLPWRSSDPSCHLPWIDVSAATIARLDAPVHEVSLAVLPTGAALPVTCVTAGRTVTIFVIHTDTEMPCHMGLI
jgi:hypothetical protein